VVHLSFSVMLSLTRYLLCHCFSATVQIIQGAPKNFTPLRFSDNFFETAENF